MKKINLVAIMLVSILLTSCGDEDNKKDYFKKEPISYTQQTVDVFNKLEPPVTLFAKSKRNGSWGVTLMDGNGKLHNFGNLSTLSSDIATSYEPGDILINDD